MINQKYKIESQKPLAGYAKELRGLAGAIAGAKKEFNSAPNKIVLFEIPRECLELEKMANLVEAGNLCTAYLLGLRMDEDTRQLIPTGLWAKMGKAMMANEIVPYLDPETRFLLVGAKQGKAKKANTKRLARKRRS